MIYTLRPGMWASVSAGYGSGGSATVNGVSSQNKQGNFLWAASMGYAFNRYHGVKLAFVNGRTVEETGVDYNQIQVGYSFMWGEAGVLALMAVVVVLINKQRFFNYTPP